jgi:hypothetical protein
LTGDEELVSSGESEEYSKRNPGEANREFFQERLPDNIKRISASAFITFSSRFGSWCDGRLDGPPRTQILMRRLPCRIKQPCEMRAETMAEFRYQNP